ncbi:hypothetical protein O9993_03530 [Vibrio lentus]|nr:hypothetical protein [Vibrio lentus]
MSTGIKYQALLTQTLLLLLYQPCLFSDTSGFSSAALVSGKIDKAFHPLRACPQTLQTLKFTRWIITEQSYGCII